MPHKFALIIGNMKPILLTIIFLFTFQRLQTSYSTNKEARRLERKLSKFLTNPNDVVQMKISFNNPDEEKFEQVMGKPRRLQTIKSTKGSHKHTDTDNMNTNRKNRYNTNKYAIYRFKDAKLMPSQFERNLSQSKRYHKNSLKRKLESESDLQPNPLSQSINKTAKALGIHTTTDAIMAGAGTAALLYGINHKQASKKQTNKSTLNLQKSYLFKKSYNNQLGVLIKDLRLLVDKLENVQRKTVATQEAIVGNIDNRIMFLDQ